VKPPKSAEQFRRKLAAWYRRNHRKLPWRETRDPYRVLVSELMLQQTQVSRVVGFYDRFLTRFPTIHALAGARPSQVRESWEGLGYYARARNLHALARRVTATRDGVMPSTPAELQELPGIGPYTAGAVASFAFEQRAALVDTNVMRVVKRVFSPRASNRRVWDLAGALLPRTGRAAWSHNQAMIELGALVCIARKPKCGECPVRRECRSSMAI
jgi:A/G-specific adenine glycosylase